MTKNLTEGEAKALAEQYLDCDQVRRSHEEVTKADELYRFWMWNPPSFAEGHPDYWAEWRLFRLIDPDAGDDGIHKLSVDMARYYSERSETDRDYWDAVRRILATKLNSSDSSIRSEALDDPHLCGWLVDVLEEHRTAPKKRRGKSARTYFARDGCIYFAMHALCERGPLNQAAASEWIGERVNLSREAVTSIYRKARSVDVSVGD